MKQITLTYWELCLIIFVSSVVGRLVVDGIRFLLRRRRERLAWKAFLNLHTKP